MISTFYSPLESFLALYLCSGVFAVASIVLTENWAGRRQLDWITDCSAFAMLLIIIVSEVFFSFTDTDPDLDRVAIVSGFGTVAAVFAGRSIVDGLSPNKPKIPAVPIVFVIFEVAVLTVGFAFIYSVLGINALDAAGRPETYHDFGNCLYFSVMTLTTVGYGDFSPTPLARPFAAVQAASGYMLLALMIAMITTRIQQPPKPKKRRRY